MLGLEMKDIKKLEKSLMLKRFDTPADAARHVSDAFGKPEKAEDIEKLLLQEGNFALFKDVVPALNRLKKKYKLALISNTQCFNMKSFFSQGHDKYFNLIAFSYDTGMLKPDSKVFKFVLDKLRVRPDEAVMVGDNMSDDILAAEKLGMNGVLIKRDGSKFTQSWAETRTHTKTISSLEELESALET